MNITIFWEANLRYFFLSSKFLLVMVFFVLILSFFWKIKRNNLINFLMFILDFQKVGIEER